MITFVLPTRNRPTELHETLVALGALEGVRGEVYVIDNASTPAAVAPAELPNGLPVRVVRCDENLGAAGRNLGVRSAHEDSEWVVLLDDDSAPIDAGFVAALDSQPADVPSDDRRLHRRHQLLIQHPLNGWPEDRPRAPAAAATPGDNEQLVIIHAKSRRRAVAIPKHCARAVGF